MTHIENVIAYADFVQLDPQVTASATQGLDC